MSTEFFPSCLMELSCTNLLLSLLTSGPAIKTLKGENCILGWFDRIFTNFPQVLASRHPGQGPGQHHATGPHLCVRGWGHAWYGELRPDCAVSLPAIFKWWLFPEVRGAGTIPVRFQWLVQDLRISVWRDFLKLRDFWHYSVNFSKNLFHSFINSYWGQRRPVMLYIRLSLFTEPSSLAFFLRFCLLCMNCRVLRYVKVVG